MICPVCCEKCSTTCAIASSTVTSWPCGVMRSVKTAAGTSRMIAAARRPGLQKLGQFQGRHAAARVKLRVALAMVRQPATPEPIH
jgi:hypothetical protein